MGAWVTGLLLMAGGTAVAGPACCGAAKAAADDACAQGAGGAKACAGTANEAVQGAVAEAPAAAVESATAQAKPQTLCPVMKAPINRNLYVDHDGKRIYVCCKGCLRPVQADPAKYIRQLEEQGIELEKTPAK